MLNFVGPEDIAVTAQMMRAGFAGAILIVEGATDERLLARFVFDDACRILCANGKENALGAVARLAQQKFAGVLAFVDADFDRIDGEMHDAGNVVMSDHHDVEIMVIASPALDKVLVEYASSGKMSSQSAHLSGLHIRDLLLREAAKLAEIRHLNKRKRWPLRFKEMDYSKFVDTSTLHIDLVKAVLHVVAATKAPGLRPDDVVAELPNPVRTDRLLEFCSGHDVTSMLAIGLKRCLGSHTSHVACKDNVEKLLRLAYEENQFVNTDAFRSIRAWEKANSGYRVLRRLAGEESSSILERA